MCPLYPLHLIFTWGLLVLFLWVSVGESLATSLGNTTSMVLKLTFENSPVQIVDIFEGEKKNVTFYIEDTSPELVADLIKIKEDSEDGLNHVELSQDSFPLQYDKVSIEPASMSGELESNTVEISGSFLGFSKLNFILTSQDRNDEEYMEKTQEVQIKVHRKSSTLDIIFIHVIILLVLVAYINMGCAIDVNVIKDTLRRPIAPAIGLVSQYMFMPLVSFGLGWLLFSSRPELWLGLFLTGCSPGGGGSNMWTYILGGSLDLSITMTFLSTVFAFATLPLWVYALGPFIFPDGYFGKLPYRNIAFLVFGLVVPCCIGLGIRRCSPRIADILKKALKPLSIFFILFIMTFGVYANLYIFSFFNWQVVVAGFCLPFFGFLFGGSVSSILKRNCEEVIAISIETGVQNTGIAIGVLKVALDQFSPLDDIAIVLPVAIATMTPVPLFTAYIIKFFRDRKSDPKKIILNTTECNSSVALCNGVYKNKTDSNGNSSNLLEFP